MLGNRLVRLAVAGGGRMRTPQQRVGHAAHGGHDDDQPGPIGLRRSNDCGGAADRIGAADRRAAEFHDESFQDTSPVDETSCAGLIRAARPSAPTPNAVMKAAVGNTAKRLNCVTTLPMAGPTM